MTFLIPENSRASLRADRVTKGSGDVRLPRIHRNPTKRLLGRPWQREPRQLGPPRRTPVDGGPPLQKNRLRSRQYATSPTPRASCRAACITISTQSRWSTDLRGFLDRLFGRYREIAAADLSATETIRRFIGRLIRGDRQRPSCGGDLSGRAPRLASQERYGYIAELNTRIPRPMALDAPPRRRRRRVPHRPEPEARVPIYARHRVGGGHWYRPGGTMGVEDVAGISFDRARQSPHADRLCAILVDQLRAEGRATQEVRNPMTVALRGSARAGSRRPRSPGR